jgi:alkyl sulfatase BDS1-like metallo-beta-lactamase superfamily hydrolase
VEDGHLESSCGAAEDADVRVETDIETFFPLVLGDLTPADAVEQKRAKIEGDPGAVERCFKVLSMAPRNRPAARAAA